MQIPTSGDDWVGLSDEPLPVTEALDWAHRPDCGAVVLFSGVARDHSSDRSGVDQLEYEAYEAQVQPRLAELAAEARTRWPDIGRLVMIHRVGELVIGDSAVVCRCILAASPGGIRCRPILHRCAQGHHSDLETRTLGPRRELGPRSAAHRRSR